MINANAIGVTVSGSLKPSRVAVKPPTSVIRKANVSFSR